MDSHKIIMTVMEMTFERLKPKVTYHRDYKKLCNDRFREYLYCVLETLILNEMGLKNYENCVSKHWTTLSYKKKQHVCHE